MIKIWQIAAAIMGLGSVTAGGISLHRSSKAKKKADEEKKEAIAQAEKEMEARKLAEEKVCQESNARREAEYKARNFEKMNAELKEENSTLRRENENLKRPIREEEARQKREAERRKQMNSFNPNIFDVSDDME